MGWIFPHLKLDDMKQVLTFFAWLTILLVPLALFWPALLEWIGYPIKSGVAHLVFAITFMLINIVINGFIFWLYGGPTAIRKFREALRKNNV